MKKQKFVLFLSLTLIVVFGLLSLPNFSFKIKDRKFSFNGVDFKALGVDSQLLNFRKGEGIFSGNEVRGELVFAKENIDSHTKEAELSKTVDLIRDRADYSLLYDVKVRGEIVDDNYLVVLEFADHYKNPQLITKWLSTQGSVTFLPAATSETQDFSILPLNDYDIEGTIAIESYSSGNYLTFAFNDSVKSDFNNALPSDSFAYISMLIGDDIVYNLYRKTNTGNKSMVLADPSATTGYDLLTAEERIVLLNVTKSYFREASPLENSVTVSDAVASIPPDFAPEGASLIAIGLCLAVLIFIVLIINKLKFSALPYFLTLLLLWAFSTLVVLKLFGAFLSFSTVLGFILSLSIVAFFGLKALRSADEDEQKTFIRDLRVLCVALVLNQLLLDRLLMTLQQYSDFFGTVMASALILFMVSFAYKHILNLYLSDFNILPSININLRKNGK